MCRFKPSKKVGGLGDSSDELDDMGDSDEIDSDASLESDDDDDDDIDAEEVPDVGEEAGLSRSEVNPLFVGEEDDSSDESFTDSEDETQEENKADDEDELIKALKSAREKKVRNSPPDIKTQEMITDLSFHPEADMVVIGNISGEISVFNYSNDINELKKKLKISKKTLRGVEFDSEGHSLLTISKDKSLRILDTETWAVK